MVVSPQGTERGENVTCRIMIERDPDRTAAAPRRERGDICRFLRLCGELAGWAVGSRESCAEGGIKVQLHQGVSHGVIPRRPPFDSKVFIFQVFIFHLRGVQVARQKEGTTDTRINSPREPKISS